MPFRFKRKETLAAAFQRIAGEELAVAVIALEKPEGAGVHAARRVFKRLRALLRLSRSALPPDAAAAASRELRSLGRQLAPIRDSQVRVTTFEKLAGRGRTSAVAKLRATLSSQRGAATAREHSRLPALIARVRRLAGRFPVVAPEAGWSALRRGLKRAYRRTRYAHAEARAELSIEAFHTWRRRCKDYESQLQLLRKAGSGDLQRQLRKLAKLNEALGDDRDLASLDQALAATPGKARETIGPRIARRRQKLERRAFDLANQLFFPKPSDIVEELGRAWKKWHRG